MALSDTREFLEDLLLRFDPALDLSDGSRAQAEIIQPILTRLGSDPFDDDIETFILNRIQQAYPDLAISEEDALRDTVVDPMRVLIEPLVREVKLIKLRSSLQNIESLSDAEVDALLANHFQARVAGGFATGTVRLYFSNPQTVTVTLVNPMSTRSGQRFFPSSPQQITADQMLLNVEGTEYYFDVTVRAENRGDEYNVGPGQVVSVANMPTAVRVRNPRRMRGGAPRETSVEFAARAEESQSDKTLNVQRGIRRTLSEAFPGLRRLYTVGFRDPEMKRDVVRGGSLGPIPEPDALGPYYGQGTPADDLDADTETPLLEASANFISRLGSAGSDPERWYLSVSYAHPVTSELVVTDARITEIVSETRVRTDHAFPVATTPVPVTWALREKKITLTDVPGGIVLPDTASGTLELRSDQVHIGGKIDVYVAGETEDASAQITGLADESPQAQGLDAQTASTDIVQINDLDLTLGEAGSQLPGRSLVLGEGEDAGSYRILEAVGASPLQVRIDQTMTGTQGGLLWRIVDDINVELTDPKEPRIDGADMVLAAGNPQVTTTGATNFLDAGVREDDVLQLFGDDAYAGDYTITEVEAVSLRVDPAPPRTVSGASYRIFRRSEAVDPPLLRVRDVELLDSAGAPVGTKIPYRDPVLVRVRAFQNEGSDPTFDDEAIVGLVSDAASTFAVGSTSFLWATYDPARPWAGLRDSGAFSFGAGSKTASQIVDELNADPALVAARARAFVLDDGQRFGIYCPDDLRLLAGTALAPMGMGVNWSNSTIRAADGSLFGEKVQRGDVIEIIEGVNAGTVGRLVTNPTFDDDFAYVGIGPYGTPYAFALYDTVVLNPDAKVRVRIGRPSVGSARVYFTDPTSAEFDYRDTVFQVEGATRRLLYRPDPENLRTITPAPPQTTLPQTGVTDTTSGSELHDTEASFLQQGVRPGDLLEILYRPIEGSTPLPSSTNIAVGGSALVFRVGSGPFVTVAFPFDMPRQDVLDYINDRTGVEVASLGPSDHLRLRANDQIEISAESDAAALAALGLSAPATNQHPQEGRFIIAGVDPTTLTLAGDTPYLSTGSVPDTQYRIRRHVQRISSTEMNEQQDATGLYYVDVELQSVAPGNDYNAEAGSVMEVSGHRADGYRLSADNDALTFSRAEVLRAEISRTMLLVGSSDSPVEAVQLSRQNVQVNYDRSQLVDEVQSFVDSDFERVVSTETLVRHLLPHYWTSNWVYVGGPAEPEMLDALEEALDAVEPNTQLEVGDLVDVLRRRGATSVYVPDPDAPTGRRPPLGVIVYHTEDRRVRAMLVTDFIDTVRTQRFIADDLRLTRQSPGGIRE